MKKLGAILLLVISITGCSTSEISTEDTLDTTEVSVENYIVWGKVSKYFNIYGNVLNNNLKTLTSNINGEVVSLSCDVGTKVIPNTVVAKIAPDTDSLSYRNNLVQLHSLQSQLVNLKQIKQTTLSDFETKFRQLELQESELKNQREIVNETIWDEDGGIKNQLQIIEDSLVILNENEISSLKTIDDSILNLKKTAYNSTKSWVKRLDEVFWITDKNKSLNDDYDDYIGVKDSILKNEVRIRIREVIQELESVEENYVNYSNEEISSKMWEYSELFSDAGDVISNSVSSSGRITDAEIDILYAEFNGYSDGLITYKTSLDTYINSRNTAVLTYAWKRKELESSKSELLTNETTLNRNKDTIGNNEQNLKEQYITLENTKSSTIKGIDNSIISLEQAINQLNITFRQDIIYAGIKGTVKTKAVSINNNVGIGTPICTIVPENNSLKLEVYSPNILDIGMEFEYYKDKKMLGKGKIVSESPVRNAATQNYTYEWEISFWELKEGDYLDIKVITEVVEDEIWIPLKYIAPKLDGYYVNVKNNEGIMESKKVEVGKMNNGEIMIKSGLEFWDILQ